MRNEQQRISLSLPLDCSKICGVMFLTATMTMLATTVPTTSAALDTGALITSLCTQLEKDAAPFEVVDIDLSKCTCTEIPEACKELETLPYDFDTTCNKLLDKLLPAEYIGLVTCSCDMFDNACKWFKKQNEGTSGATTKVRLQQNVF